MKVGTAYIVPAFSDQAGQCRIVARPGHYPSWTVRDDYDEDLTRKEPRWSEVGLMNSAGKLVCCDTAGDLQERLKECEPLMAGLVIQYIIEE